jgi:hypothetical protein
MIQCVLVIFHCLALMEFYEAAGARDEIMKTLNGKTYVGLALKVKIDHKRKSENRNKENAERRLRRKGLKMSKNE